jgi:hypothetical protein
MTSAGVVLVRPDGERESVAQLAGEVASAAKNAGLRVVKALRATRAQVSGEPWNRPAQFLRPEDARLLYGLVHRRRILLVSFSDVYVRRDPSKEPVVRRSAMELGTFVEHKATHEFVRDAAAARRCIDDFATRHELIECEGEDDPRCLPLHAFSVDRVWSALREPSGRDDFAREHGPARFRVDTEEKRWSRADRRAYHGASVLVVAGRELAQGMHWDVTSERGKARLTTSHEVWQIADKRQAYLNVYPDAHVRPGPQARRVWPRGRP